MTHAQVAFLGTLTLIAWSVFVLLIGFSAGRGGRGK